MALDVNRELGLLKKMTGRQLREKHIELFGEPSRSGHRDFLVRRIIWRMQALDEGDLSERARTRAAELARDVDLRLSAPPASRQPSALHVQDSTSQPPPMPQSPVRQSDDRLPMPGTLITRQYRGKTIEVRVLSKGFEYEGSIFRSLSAVALAVTGSHWNGWLFFGLTPHASQTKKQPAKP